MSIQLAHPLFQILREELSHGNEVVEESTWPPNYVKLVILKRRFHKEYPLTSEVKFCKIDDYHYWFAEYNYESNEGGHSLACGFKPPRIR